MLRTIVLLGAGVVLGAVGAHGWIARSAESLAGGPGGGSFLDLDGVRRVLGLAGTRQAPQLQARAEAYRAAASFDDAYTLEKALAAAAARPDSPMQTLELDALLMRLAEIDAQRALSAAQSSRLGERFVAAVLAAWVEDDADAALAAVGMLEPASLRQASALAMLTALGAGREAALRIAEALPPPQRAAFELAAIGVRAERDLLGAFDDAQTMADDALRREALQLVARVWAKADPAGGFARGAALPQAEQTAFRAALMHEWTMLDSDAVFAYLESVDVDEIASAVPLTTLAVFDAGRLFDLAQRMPYVPGSPNMFSLAAALAAVGSDPLALSPRVAAMPSGYVQERVVRQLMQRLAEEDPAAAIAWVRRLDPSSQNAQMALVQAIGARDLERALELVAELTPAGSEPNLVSSALSSAFTSIESAQDAGAAVARLAERDHPVWKRAAAELVSHWASFDLEAALVWAVAHADSLDAGAFANLARIAASDPRAAVTYLDRVPTAHRAAWAQQAAAAYARYDLQGAIEWFATLGDAAVREAAFEAVVMQAAGTDPLAAARLLDDAPPPAELARAAAQRIASRWATADPRAAADWAERRSDAAQRSAAVTAVASAWTQRDATAATAWVRRLPVEIRDAPLAAVLAEMANGGPVDTRLFSDFSSDQARASAASRIASLLARRDAAQARAIADAYVKNPQQRQAVEEQIVRRQAGL